MNQRVRECDLRPGYLERTRQRPHRVHRRLWSPRHTVRYFDENDGQATFALVVGGAVVGMWTANVDDHTWKNRTFTGVFIASGAEIRVEGARAQGEHARVDYVEIR